MSGRRIGLVALVVIGLGGLANRAPAAVVPNPLFSDGMVLEQHAPVPIWGNADEGEAVTVDFQGQKISTTAHDGKWMARLQDLKPGGPFQMRITGHNEIQIRNVLVGEVWLAGGQSNMEWPLARDAHAQETLANLGDSSIRFFKVQRAISPTPLTTVKGVWEECTRKTAENLSAVAYYFARDLRRALDVPVGIVQSDWSGSLAETWVSRQGLASLPEFRNIEAIWEKNRQDYLADMKQYQAALATYEKENAHAKAIGKEAPKPPTKPRELANRAINPTYQFNAMIAPLVPYALRGVIWYQGESNALRAESAPTHKLYYQPLFAALIKDWRRNWDQGDFPFLFVQLAPFRAAAHEPQESDWAAVREAQLFTCRSVPHTAMAVITDVGDEVSIHPLRKEAVGSRLALAAEAIAYGRAVEYCGPIYDHMTVAGSRVVLSFRHAQGGLTVQGPALQGFTIAGPDHRFVNAMAQVEGDRVAVWSPEVSHPVAVRFGWADYPVVNLWNKAGLPASPFRTDSLPRQSPGPRLPTKAKSGNGTVGPVG
jgi:sialate O-acetylesterase